MVARPFVTSRQVALPFFGRLMHQLAGALRVFCSHSRRSSLKCCFIAFRSRSLFLFFWCGTSLICCDLLRLFLPSSPSRLLSYYFPFNPPFRFFSSIYFQIRAQGRGSFLPFPFYLPNRPDFFFPITLWRLLLSAFSPVEGEAFRASCIDPDPVTQSSRSSGGLTTRNHLSPLPWSGFFTVQRPPTPVRGGPSREHGVLRSMPLFAG